MSFKKITPNDIADNPFQLIGQDWMLITSADKEGDLVCGKDYNTMTASWGGVGVLWNKPVAFVFVRPERHTYLFTEDSPYMTLSFFGGEMRDALTFCGRNSGRDTDKAAECSLTPVFEQGENGRSVYFQEAKCVLKLRRIYADSIEPSAFVDQAPLEFYHTDGFHKMYVCEITDVLVKD